MKLIWRPSARARLDEIVSYIGQRNYPAAEKLAAEFHAAAARLVHTPLAYRVGRVSGTREAVISRNYIMIYRVIDDSVEIVDLIHARRKYP